MGLYRHSGHGIGAPRTVGHGGHGSLTTTVQGHGGILRRSSTPLALHLGTWGC